MTDNHTNHINPSIDGIKDIENTFKISTLNVAGVNSITKQTQLLDFIRFNNISIMGLSEIKLRSNMSDTIYKNEEEYQSQ